MAGLLAPHLLERDPGSVRVLVVTESGRRFCGDVVGIDDDYIELEVENGVTTVIDLAVVELFELRA
jgi:hypothetical protein